MCLNSSNDYGLTDFKQNGCTTCVPATPTGLQLTVELAPSVGAALWAAQRGWGALVVDGDTALAALVVLQFRCHTHRRKRERHTQQTRYQYDG